MASPGRSSKAGCVWGEDGGEGAHVITCDQALFFYRAGKKKKRTEERTADRNLGSMPSILTYLEEETNRCVREFQLNYNFRKLCSKSFN